MEVLVEHGADVNHQDDYGNDAVNAGEQRIIV